VAAIFLDGRHRCVRAARSTATSFIQTTNDLFVGLANRVSERSSARRRVCQDRESLRSVIRRCRCVLRTNRFHHLIGRPCEQLKIDVAGAVVHDGVPSRQTVINSPIVEGPCFAAVDPNVIFTAAHQRDVTLVSASFVSNPMNPNTIAKVGRFAYEGKKPIRLSKISFLPGFFDESIPPTAAATRAMAIEDNAIHAVNALSS